MRRAHARGGGGGGGWPGARLLSTVAGSVLLFSFVFSFPSFIFHFFVFKILGWPVGSHWRGFSFVSCSLCMRGSPLFGLFSGRAHESSQLQFYWP